MYPFRILQAQPLRFFLTISGIALCVVLMLFLLSTYRAVSDGSVDFVAQNRADLWVLQKNATNILRGSSILSTGHGTVLRDVDGVESASPVLLLLCSVKRSGRSGTVFLTGFEPKSGLGRPPRIVQGRTVINDNEIVLDRSFAAKFRFFVGDIVEIQDDSLVVVGLSTGTNAFVIQYAFVTLHRAQSLIGFPSLVTCYLVRTAPHSDPERVALAIRAELPGVETYNHETFLQNNIEEMENGFLPLLYILCVLGSIVLTTILSLLLSITIVEHRNDFAVMKTLGSPRRFLLGPILGLGLLLSAAGEGLALAAFFPLTEFLEKLFPEISTKTSLEQIVAITIAVGLMSLLSAAIPLRRLRSIYPQESFM